MITIANWIADLFILSLSLILLVIGAGLGFVLIGVIVKEIKTECKLRVAVCRGPFFIK